MKKLLYLLLVIFALTLVSCEFDLTVSVTTYTIRFENYDNTLLDKLTVLKNETPKYTGSTPTRPEDDSYTYEFDGWDPEIVPAVEDKTYVAKFKSIEKTPSTEPVVKQYLITFVDAEGQVILVKKYDEGTPYSDIVVPENPTKDATAQYSYEFETWSPEVNDVTKDQVYEPRFTETLREYTITFVDYNNQELDTQVLEYGETPEYEGTPSREGNNQVSYEFSGWTPEITTVTGNQTYKATYIEHKKFAPSNLSSLKEATLVSVYDGDSVILKINNENVEIRLSDIDAPEWYENYGYEAEKELGNLLKDISIYVEEGSTDSLNRQLAYLWILQDNQYVNINYRLVNSGLASYCGQETSEYHSYFVQAKENARDNNLGMFSEQKKLGIYEYVTLADVNIEYDGEAHVIEPEYKKQLKDGYRLVLKSESQTNVGTYEIKYELLDSDNVKHLTISANMTIINADYDVETPWIVG